MEIKYFFVNVAIISCFLASFFIFVSFFIFALNKKEYERLIERYKEKFDLQYPYSFYCDVGFFGAYAMIRFFIRLSQKKKISFLPMNSGSYSFFDFDGIKVTNWMKLFSRLWVFSYVFFSVSIVISVFI